MDRKLVRSSDIASIGYDAEAQTLEIEFHSGGIYQYFEVPESVYDELMNASSHGIYFHENIKDKYESSKIN